MQRGDFVATFQGWCIAMGLKNPRISPRVSLDYLAKASGRVRRIRLIEFFDGLSSS